MQNTGALALLGQRLRDTNIWVRSKASKALQNFGSAAQPQLTTMLMAFTNNATDPHVHRVGGPRPDCQRLPGQ